MYATEKGDASSYRQIECRVKTGEEDGVSTVRHMTRAIPKSARTAGSIFPKRKPIIQQQQQQHLQPRGKKEQKLMRGRGPDPVLL